MKIFVGCLLAVGVALSARNVSADGIKIKDIFSDHNAVGTLVIERLSDGYQIVQNRTRASKRLYPASTFKIPHTLIALELGVTSGLDQMMPWDGVKRQISAWNQPQSIRDAFKNSTVPVYQSIARSIGKQRMGTALRQLDYGNMETGEAIDRFWLQGPLRISALEQIAFLKRLYSSELPFSEKNVALTKEVMEVERSSTHVHRGKTGWSIAMQPAIGWYVGWEEREHDVLFFALNMDMTQPFHRSSRKRIVREALSSLFD